MSTRNPVTSSDVNGNRAPIIRRRLCPLVLVQRIIFARKSFPRNGKYNNATATPICRTVARCTPSVTPTTFARSPLENRRRERVFRQRPSYLCTKRRDIRRDVGDTRALLLGQRNNDGTVQTTRCLFTCFLFGRNYRTDTLLVYAEYPPLPSVFVRSFLSIISPAFS